MFLAKNVQMFGDIKPKMIFFFNFQLIQTLEFYDIECSARCHYLHDIEQKTLICRLDQSDAMIFIHGKNVLTRMCTCISLPEEKNPDSYFDCDITCKSSVLSCLRSVYLLVLPLKKPFPIN